MNTPESSPSAKKFPWLPVVGGCCVLLVVSAIAFSVIGSKLAKDFIDEATQDPKVAATLFFTTLRTDAASAYTLTADDFREATTEEDLAAYVVDSEILTTWTVLDFPTVNIDNGFAMLEGTMETDTEYTPVYVETTADSAGVWRVNYFELGYEPSEE